MAAGTLPPESPFHEETPTITDHAADQWDRRTATWSKSPEAAWHEAIPLPETSTGPHDELRVHGRQGVVFARDQDVIRTVLDVAGEDAESWLQTRVYAAVGPVWLDAPVDDRPGGEQ